MVLALTTGQKLWIAGVAAVFILFAVGAAFVAPRRDRDFPGRRGLPWFVAASVLLFVAMMAAILVFAREAEEEHDAQEAPAGEVAEGDPEAGAGVFASAGCGSCHALEAAGTTGTIGPDLDQARPAYEATVEQVRNGGGGMPAFADSLSEDEIRDVAAFVVQATG